MKIVIFRAWWAFWRRPIFGLNPFGWQTLSEITAEDGSIIMADGCWKPNDGGGGNFTFVKANKNNANGGTIIDPDNLGVFDTDYRREL